MGNCRWRVARPLLVMDAVRWGVAHHSLLLQGLTVVRRSLVLLRLPNHLRLEVVHLCLVLLLLLRLVVPLQHQLLLVLLPLLHCRDRERKLTKVGMVKYTLIYTVSSLGLRAVVGFVLKASANPTHTKQRL